MARADAASRDCDLFIVLGSSLVVFPAAGFPLIAKQGGALLAIVNRETTDQDRFADLVLHEEIGAVMAAVTPWRDAAASALPGRWRRSNAHRR
jgi:NAD-dependent deacetylase